MLIRNLYGVCKMGFMTHPYFSGLGVGGFRRGVAHARFTSPQVLAFLLQCYAADVVAQAGVTGHAHKADLNLDALADSVAPDGPGLPPPRAIRKKPRPRKTQDDRRQEVRWLGRLCCFDRLPRTIVSFSFFKMW